MPSPLLGFLDFFFKLEEDSDRFFAYLSDEFSFPAWLILSAEESEHFNRMLPGILAYVLSMSASLRPPTGSHLSLYLYSSSSCFTISSSYSGLMVLGGRRPEPLGELPEPLPLDEPLAESLASELAIGSLILSMIFGALSLLALMFGYEAWQSESLS